ncbi:MAG: HDIG domain-containing metalloprotein [Bdellovibrionota bacterium]
MQIALVLFISLIIGSGIGLIVFRLIREQIIKKANEEAQEFHDDVKEWLDLRTLEENEKYQEIEASLWAKQDAEILRIEERIETLQELIDENKKKQDDSWQRIKSKNQNYEREIQSQESKIKNREKSLDSLKDQAKELSKQMVDSMIQKFGFSVPEIKTQIEQDLEKEVRDRAIKFLEMLDEDLKTHSESRAKQHLDTALDRFIRPYCSERGIGSVQFPEDPQIRKNFCDPAGNNIKAVQDACGCDVIVDDQSDQVGIAGYDPVRRELTRRTLERILKEKKFINPDGIRRIAENQKKELFRQIKADGDNIARELRLEGMHPEIRQMMGSLRYRYSFTQNQYFHCGEVGWLCGLLAAELQLDTKKARRSGLLHDLGKSMDHTIDGGHAMIGADFIEKRGEAADVVHNVRAHHFDVAPATDHAYLVIAADAISGARPGARRSTIESYNQKVTVLQDIARSYDGVTDCYILSGGRECRVMVNGKKVNDLEALTLSQKIARQIEEECSYPGQIKVVVVRETLVNESTMARA